MNVIIQRRIGDSEEVKEMFPRRSNGCDSDNSPRKETAKWVSRKNHHFLCNKEMARGLEVRQYFHEVQHPLKVLERQTQSCRSAKRSRIVGNASLVLEI